jgi:hypothetical protein
MDAELEAVAGGIEIDDHWGITYMYIAGGAIGGAICAAIADVGILNPLNRPRPTT